MPAAGGRVVLCAHGTADPAGRAAVADLADAVRRRLPGRPVELCYVDVQQPRIGELVAGLSATEAALIVPLFLASGYHVLTDVGAAVAGRPELGVTAPLGPSAALADLLIRGIRALDGRPDDQDADDHLVLAAAGSRRPQALADVTTMRDLLADRWPGPVTVGFGAAAEPTIAEAVERARTAGPRRVIVASYLLAPGRFADVARAAGADLVTPPLAILDLPGVVDLVIARITADHGQ